jgi:hypothetical protein
MEYGVHDPTGQAACLEFGNKQAVGNLWQSVTIDVVGLAVLDDDPVAAPRTSEGMTILKWGLD